MSRNVLYSPPYFDAVMHKCCIQTSEVSRLICSTQLMGDVCFNDIVDKTFHLQKRISVLFYAIWASTGKLHCMKNATLLQNKHNIVQ